MANINAARTIGGSMPNGDILVPWRTHLPPWLCPHPSQDPEPQTLGQRALFQDAAGDGSFE